MTRFFLLLIFAVVVAAGSLILLGSSALSAGGGGFPKEGQSNSSASALVSIGPLGATSNPGGDGVWSLSDTEEEGTSAGGSADFLVLVVVVFLLAMADRDLLCALFEQLRPSTIYGSILERPD
jgi:hypothetical protein